MVRGGAQFWIRAGSLLVLPLRRCDFNVASVLRG
jgi:hypothetical protein